MNRLSVLRAVFLCAVHAVLLTPASAEPRLVPSGPPAEPSAATAACTLTPGPQNTFSYVWFRPEELKTVAWKIPVSACQSCAASGGLNVRSLTLRMRWPFACTASATVSIVGAIQEAGCTRPDTAAVLCPPVTSTIRSTVQNIALVNHVLPLSSNCCISGDAYVLVRFTGLGACPSLDGTSPGLLASTQTCQACQEYFMALNHVLSPLGLTEWCQPAGNEPGPGLLMWMALDADCCQVTPAQRPSWGTVKQTYR